MRHSHSRNYIITSRRTSVRRAAASDAAAAAAAAAAAPVMASSARDTLLFPFVLSAVVALVLLYVAACKLFVAYYRDDYCPPSMGDAKEDDAHEATPIYALTGVCVVHPNGKVVFGEEEE